MANGITQSSLKYYKLFKLFHDKPLDKKAASLALARDAARISANHLRPATALCLVYRRKISAKIAAPNAATYNRR